MSTDNGKVLKNQETERSLFGLSQTVRTTQKLGQLGVMDCAFCMPKDTIRHRSSKHYELKPTVSKISSSIYHHTLSCAVNFRSILKYYDEFISKGDSFISASGFNVPYVQKQEDKSVTSLPCMPAARIFGYFLATMGFGNPNRFLKFAEPTNYADDSLKAQGNLQDWRFSTLISRSSAYKGASVYPTSAYNKEDSDAIKNYAYPFWYPRLIGDGYYNSGWNIENVNKDGVVYHSLSTDKADLIEQCKVMFGKYFYEADVKRIIIASAYDKNENCVYFKLVGSTKSMSEAVGLERGWDVRTNDYDFLVRTATNEGVYTYGDVELSTTPLANDLITEHNFVNTFIANETRPEGLFPPSYEQPDSEKLKAMKLIIFNAVCCCLFNTSELLGSGSLCESLGVHLFQRLSVLSNYGSIFPPFFSSMYLPERYTIDSSAWSVNYGLLRSIGDQTIKETSPSINVLPFFAYQKIVTERFLLPHNVLSSSSGETSSVDYDAKFDSPVFRNNMVPTMCYYKSDDNSDIDELSIYPTTGNWSMVVSGTSVENYGGPAYWHYVIPINQLISVFLPRNVMRSIDAYTKVWQKRDNNVQEIINSSDYNAVDSSLLINAKKYLLSHALSRFVRFGNTDMTAKAVIENHFGVNDLPSDCDNTILLNRNSGKLQTQDVINTGGAVNESGEPRELGDKSTIVSDDVPLHNDFDCFCKDFSFIITLHWFSCDTFRYSVPQWSTYQLGKNRFGLRKAFQVAFLPEYQNTGDDPLYLSDILFGENPSAPNIIGWTNKNNLNKDDGTNQLLGEWQDRFSNQIVTNNPLYKNLQFSPSLTYGYLQPSTFEYYIPLVDRFGSAIMVTSYNEIDKKSTMTKLNNVGL